MHEHTVVGIMNQLLYLRHVGVLTPGCNTMATIDDTDDDEVQYMEDVAVLFGDECLDAECGSVNFCLGRLGSTYTMLPKSGLKLCVNTVAQANREPLHTWRILRQ